MTSRLESTNTDIVVATKLCNAKYFSKYFRIIMKRAFFCFEIKIQLGLIAFKMLRVHFLRDTNRIYYVV